MSDVHSDCTVEQCEAAPVCGVCRMRKKPLGRDSMDNGLCSDDCEGYRVPPLPGHLWPGEIERARQPESES